MSNDQAIEQQIQAKDLTAPRVTPAHIDSRIVSEHYFTAADGATWAHIEQSTERQVTTPDLPQSLSLLTFCVLVLRNGFTVTGESACASPENFDPEIGRQIARGNAMDKIWLLEGYLLRQSLHEESQ